MIHYEHAHLTKSILQTGILSKPSASSKKIKILRISQTTNGKTFVPLHDLDLERLIS
jgi:predicted neuraminidase